MSNNDSNNNTTWWPWIYKGVSKGVSNIWGYASSYFKPSAKQIKDAGELGSNDTIALEQTPPAQEQKSTSSGLGNVGGIIYSAAGSVGAGSYKAGSYLWSGSCSVVSTIYLAGYGAGAAVYNTVGSTYSAIFSSKKLTNAVEEPKDQALDSASKGSVSVVEAGNPVAVNSTVEVKPLVEAEVKPLVEAPALEVKPFAGLVSACQQKFGALIKNFEPSTAVEGQANNDVIAPYHQADLESQSHYERVLDGVDLAMVLNYF